MEVTTFTCSICGEPSREICTYCTKDACANHLCERCGRCSDCCNCVTPVVHSDAGERANGYRTYAQPNGYQRYAAPAAEKSEAERN